MAITQTVDIPINHRITIDVPHEVPAGATIITFTPASSVKKKLTPKEEREYISKNFERLNRETMDILSYQNMFLESED
uniref:Uncharacterized protein n=1 Tax=uncultured bacterium contig00142 TaxID=1181584 RepID=A0A806JZS0_9BACT|nr:hypothetical protein [uncultured bacterium contig00142]